MKKKSASVVVQGNNVPFDQPGEFFRWVEKTGYGVACELLTKRFKKGSQCKYWVALNQWAEENNVAEKISIILGHTVFDGPV